jgi:hypothetical protein
MKPTDDLHLPESRLIASLVQEDSLDPGERAHLSDCPVCSVERGRIERALTGMGHTAASLTPTLRRKLTVPSRASRPVHREPFGLRSGLRSPWRIGAAAAVVLLVALGWVFSRSAQEKEIAEIRQEMIDDGRFLSELSKLEESGLPDLSAALSDEFDPDEDDFLDFVVPDPTGDATTSVPAGGIPC